MRLSTLLAEVRLPLFRNAYALLLNNFLTSGLGIIYWAVAVRLYPPSDVGIGASLVSTLMFVAAVSQFNLRFLLYRYIPRVGRGTGKLIGATYLLVAVAALLLGLLTALIGLRLGAAPDSLDAEALEIAVFTLSSVIWGLFAFQDQVLAALRLSLWVPVENLAFGLLKLGLLFFFIGFHPFGVFFSWIVSAVVGVVIASTVIFGVVLPRLHHVAITEPVSLRGMVQYVGADYVAGIIATAPGLMPAIVYVVLGAEQSAFFYPVWLFTVMLYALPVAMFTSLLVESSGGHADFQRDGRASVARIAFGLVVPVAVLTIGAPQVLLLIFGAEYAEAGAESLRLLALSAVPFTFNSFATHLARSRAQMTRVILIEAGVAVPSLVLTVALLPPMGLTGAALAFLVSQSAVAGILLTTFMRPILRSWRYRG